MHTRSISFFPKSLEATNPILLILIQFLTELQILERKRRKKRRKTGHNVQVYILQTDFCMFRTKAKVKRINIYHTQRGREREKQRKEENKNICNFFLFDK